MLIRETAVPGLGLHPRSASGRLLEAGAPEDSGRLVWPDRVWETRTGCPGPGMGKAGRPGGSTSSSHLPSSVFIADGEGLLAASSSDLS